MITTHVNIHMDTQRCKIIQALLSSFISQECFEPTPEKDQLLDVMEISNVAPILKT